jgi:hypothetical protein
VLCSNSFANVSAVLSSYQNWDNYCVREVEGGGTCQSSGNASMEISVVGWDVSAACFSARNSARAAAVEALSDKSSSSSVGIAGLLWIVVRKF